MASTVLISGWMVLGAALAGHRSTAQEKPRGWPYKAPVSVPGPGVVPAWTLNCHRTSKATMVSGSSVMPSMTGTGASPIGGIGCPWASRRKNMQVKRSWPSARMDDMEQPQWLSPGSTNGASAPGSSSRCTVDRSPMGAPFSRSWIVSPSSSGIGYSVIWISPSDALMSLKPSSEPAISRVTLLGSSTVGAPFASRSSA